MRLSVVHDTCYQYSPAVETAHHLAHLQPLDTAWQTLQSHQLLIDPEPAQCRAVRDVFGNLRTHFQLQGPHEHLHVRSHSEVDTSAPKALQAERSAAWDSVRESLRYRAGQPYDPAVGFTFASPMAPRHPDFIAYAKPSFAPGTPLLVAVVHLMQRMHDELSYRSDSTEVSTPAQEALAQREGVCQDFAHIMVACLRAMGLPARYVSGYLLTEPAPGQTRLIGSDASHAWASVHVPGLVGAVGAFDSIDGPDGADRPGLAADRQGRASSGPAGWVDFDPTNNRWGWGTPGEDYITLAIGRDYGDVSPLSGVIHGGAHHTLDVGVTVEPVRSDAG